MNNRDISGQEHHKTSAFHPFSINPVESSSNSPPHPRSSEQQELIFQSEENSQQEQNMHQDYRPSQDFYCMTCHQNFNIRISPCSHRRVKNQRYKCDYDDCNKVFNIVSGLERHKLVHSGTKPYQCDFDQCQQRFNQKSNLNRHRRIHLQQKPFICQKCCKTFTTTTNLKQHVQIHLQDKQKRKRYVCQIKGCNKQYLYMCNLKKHKQEHEDPLSDCIGQKRPDHPTFSLSIGQCSLRLLSKRNNKDHSEALITYRDVEGALIINNEHFSQVLESMNYSEDKPQQSKCMEQMEEILGRIFETVKTSVNICFQLHDQLTPISNLIVKAVISKITEISAKVFTIVLPSYSVFRDVVQNLLSDLQPE